MRQTCWIRLDTLPAKACLCLLLVHMSAAPQSPLAHLVFLKPPFRPQAPGGDGCDGCDGGAAGAAGAPPKWAQMWAKKEQEETRMNLQDPEKRAQTYIDAARVEDRTVQHLMTQTAS